MLTLLMCALDADLYAYVQVSFGQKYRREQLCRTRFFQVRNKKSGDFFGISVESRVAAHDFGAIDPSNIEETGAPLLALE